MWSEDADLANYGDLSIPPESPMPAPDAGAVVGDWHSALSTIVTGATDVFNAAAGVVKARDNAATQRAQLAFDRSYKLDTLQLQRDQLSANTTLQKLGLQTQIARAQQQLAGVVGSASGGGSMLLVIAAAVGAYFLAKKG